MPKCSQAELEEWVRRMSDELLGYREGSLDDMLTKAAELRVIERQHKQQKNVSELFESIRELNALAIELGA